MRRPRLFYFFRRSLRNLRGAPVPALVAAATLAIVIFLFGAFLLTARSLHRAVVGQAGSGEAVTVYAERGLDRGRVEGLAREIAGLDPVESVRTVTADESAGELREILGEDAVLLEGVDPEEILPATFLLTLEGPDLSRSRIETLARKLERLDGIDSVEAEALWLERFSAVVRAGRWLGLGWACLLGAGAFLVVGNTARLAALTRREEVEVLRLVGASDGFILMPFFWEGALQGVAGSAAGLGLLGGAYALVADALATDALLVALLGRPVFLEPTELVLLALSGPFLAALASVTSAARFLRTVPL